MMMPRPNEFLVVPISSSENEKLDPPLALRQNKPLYVGRRSNPRMLQNPHISRRQVKFELRVDGEGNSLILLFNEGKNHTRVVSQSRRKQARVEHRTYCRLVPGDVVEMLYDQQGQYAFLLVEASPDGSPMVAPTLFSPSVAAFKATTGCQRPGGPSPFVFQEGAVVAKGG